MLLIAPTEPPALRAIGHTSSLPEKFGADILFMVNGERCGIQRKEVSDLRASVADGRLGKELSQMEVGGLGRRLLIVEGPVKFTADGSMMNVWGSEWTRARWMGALLGVQGRGCWVFGTSNLNETIEVVKLFEVWCRRDRHGTLAARPKPGSGMWGGKPTDREWAIHFLQGIDGVGPELAARIYDQFGGMPVEWKAGVGIEWLTSVEGIGKKKAAKIHRVLADQNDNGS